MTYISVIGINRPFQPRPLQPVSICVSVAASSGVVVVFTIVLFLAGYVLQQQTVRGLQDSLRPNVPPAPSVDIPAPKLSTTLKASRAFGGQPGSAAHVAYQDFISPDEAVSRSQEVDWNRLAHIQLVSNHQDVCNSIMLFGELHRLKSPAKRVLLFPKAWAVEKKSSKGEAFDPFLDTTRRLLKLAARRYRVELRPIVPTSEDANEEEPSSYSLTSVWSLSDYDRVLILQTPGMILDATPLDAILAYAPASSLATLSIESTPGVNETDLILAMPDETSYKTLASIPLATNILPALKQNLATLVLDAAADGTHLVTSISTLHTPREEEIFDATAWLSSTAYVRFSDPKLPGPEYDVPWAQRIKARPRNKDADWVWTKLYSGFSQRRMDVCGLDLQPIYDWSTV